MNSPSTSVPLAFIDAFTEGLFSGNPAAVCSLPAFLPDQHLQRMAAEHNLSETAFLVPTAKDVWQLRWFTPSVEVELCGHATLASAHYLYEHAGVSLPALHFDTRSGRLTVRREETVLQMAFPLWQVERIAIEPDWTAHFGSIRFAGRNRADYLLLELEDAAAVEGYRLDPPFLSSINAFGIILTSAGGTGGPDFVSRFFAPRAGVPEDPVTGSAHCSLFPYWGERLEKQEMVARQVSPRGGRIEGRLADGRVVLGGQCRTYALGWIVTPLN